MNKKLLSCALAALMVLSSGAAALAADGDAATSPKDSDTGTASSGAATVQGANFAVAGDDDGTASPDDTNGADINLWGKISGTTGDKVYQLDVEWGEMYFVYIFDGGGWTPDEYVYEQGSGGRWNEQFCDGAYNIVTITNHSNDAVDAKLTFTMQPGDTEGSTIFNTTTTGNMYRVVGNFYKTNGDAKDACSKQNTYNSDSADALPNVFDGQLPGNTLQLRTAEAYNPDENPTSAESNVAAGKRSESAYFAFSGVPDRDLGKGVRHVGTVKITFEPGTLTSYPPYTK